MPSAERKLPPNQTPVDRILRWFEDHPGITRNAPKIDLKTWALAIDGEVENPQKLGWSDFLKLPMVESASDFHCVEGWSVLGCRWQGVRFRDIISLVKPFKNGKYVLFECADSYTTSFGAEELLGDDVLLAFRLDGKKLEVGLGFPVRLVAPSKYAYKSAMWVTRLRFMADRILGYWEKRGYSDTADVWKNDRFAR